MVVDVDKILSIPTPNSRSVCMRTSSERRERSVNSQSGRERHPFRERERERENKRKGERKKETDRNTHKKEREKAKGDIRKTKAER